jgi:hypothetical protein
LSSPVRLAALSTQRIAWSQVLLQFYLSAAGNHEADYAHAPFIELKDRNRILSATVLAS